MVHKALVLYLALYLLQVVGMALADLRRVVLVALEVAVESIPPELEALEPQVKEIMVAMVLMGAFSPLVVAEVLDQLEIFLLLTTLLVVLEFVFKLLDQVFFTLAGAGAEETLVLLLFLR
jgi:hypothetical protein